MQSTEIRIGDKVYRYKKPTLGVVKEARKVFGKESDVDIYSDGFVAQWDKYCAVIFENPDEGLKADGLLIEDIGRIVQGFFGLGLSATSAESVTSTSSAPAPGSPSAKITP